LAKLNWLDPGANSRISLLDKVNPIKIIEPNLQINKSVDDETPSFGQALTYTLEISHTTNSTANGYDIAIKDLIPNGLNFKTGSANLPAEWTINESTNPNIIFNRNLNLGQTAIIIYQLTVGSNTQVMANQSLINQVKLKWTSNVGENANERSGNDGNGGLNDYDSTDNQNVTITAPDLSINKTDNLTSVTAGQTIIYKLEVSNLGNGNATNVVINETVPNNSIFDLGSSTSGWSCNDKVVAETVCKFTISSLNSTTTQTINFGVRVDSQIPTLIENITNSFSVADGGKNGPDVNPNNNIDEDIDILDTSPDIQITKGNNLTQVIPGQTASYTLSISNVGNQDATGIIVTETVPSGKKFYPSGSTSGWICTNAGISGETCTFSIPQINGQNGTQNINFTVLVNSTLFQEEITNSVSVADSTSGGIDPTPENNKASDIGEVIGSPDLEIIKTNNLTEVNVGQEATYSLTVKNTGNVPANKININDKLSISYIYF
jgi:large repetitive protein